MPAARRGHGTPARSTGRGVSAPDPPGPLSPRRPAVARPRTAAARRTRDRRPDGPDQHPGPGGPPRVEFEGPPVRLVQPAVLPDRQVAHQAVGAVPRLDGRAGPADPGRPAGHLPAAARPGEEGGRRRKPGQDGQRPERGAGHGHYPSRTPGPVGCGVPGTVGPRGLGAPPTRVPARGRAVRRSDLRPPMLPAAAPPVKPCGLQGGATGGALPANADTPSPPLGVRQGPSGRPRTNLKKIPPPGLTPGRRRVHSYID